jgi:hypothetical protein
MKAQEHQQQPHRWHYCGNEWRTFPLRLHGLQTNKLQTRAPRKISGQNTDQPASILARSHFMVTIRALTQDDDDDTSLASANSEADSSESGATRITWLKHTLPSREDGKEQRAPCRWRRDAHSCATEYQRDSGVEASGSKRACTFSKIADTQEATRAGLEVLRGDFREFGGGTEGHSKSADGVGIDLVSSAFRHLPKSSCRLLNKTIAVTHHLNLTIRTVLL